MSETYIDYGDRIDGALPDDLTFEASRAAWHAVRTRAAEFTLIEARRVTFDGGYAEVLIVDCQNDAVPTRNQVGIRYRERLALLFHSDPERQPEVRALRKGFPITAHQNYVFPGEPPSLCLYFEPWSRVRRTWTPQLHLNRILWWLAETARGTLHRTDQPLEQLYFDSPYELVLPFDFQEKVADRNYRLVIQSRKDRGEKTTLVGQMIGRGAASSGISMPSLALSLPPIVHGGVEPFPGTLGALHDQFKRRGAPFGLGTRSVDFRPSFRT